MSSLLIPLATLIIIVAIVAIYRGVDVRLALFVASLLIGSLAGDPAAIIRVFFSTLTNEKFVVPLCSAMGFAQVLRLTECDKHLVHLLVRPLTKVRLFLIPGTVVVGFLVNMPIISQTSTAVVLGTVVIPVLRAARFSLVTIGAALLLGCSVGGELLNPGAPELRTVVTETEKAVVARYVEPWLPHGSAAAGAASLVAQQDPLCNVTGDSCVARIFPLNMLSLIVATLIFWLICARAEAKTTPPPEDAADTEVTFRVNYLKACVPLIPLLLLYLAAPPFNVIKTEGWLKLADKDATAGQHETRLIAVAMLIGVVIAVAVTPRTVPSVARAFDGAGYALANIVSLIVIATCFGEAIRLIGIAALLGDAIQAVPSALLPMAGVVSLAFATLCGSGMATTQSLFGFFVAPALQFGIDPLLAGAVVSLASAAGRTLSPVAAVMLMCAGMTQTNPFDLSKRVALPLVAAVIAVVIAAVVFQ